MASKSASVRPEKFHQYMDLKTTRPSAIGMPDPTCGPLIHNFVDETYEDKVDYENSIHFKNFETRVGKYLEKENMFSRRRGRKRRKIIGEGNYIFCGGEKEQICKRCKNTVDSLTKSSLCSIGLHKYYRML